jgi:SP family myo-inositol transporter-like MFS transporter 13
MSVPIYISEAAPPKVRGLLVSTTVLVITFGQFTAACVCGAFSKHPVGWRYMLGLAGVPAVLQFIGFVFMPESPRWLVSKGRLEESS